MTRLQVAALVAAQALRERAAQRREEGRVEEAAKDEKHAELYAKFAGGKDADR